MYIRQIPCIMHIGAYGLMLSVIWPPVLTTVSGTLIPEHNGLSQFNEDTQGLSTSPSNKWFCIIKTSARWIKVYYYHCCLWWKHRRTCSLAGHWHILPFVPVQCSCIHRDMRALLQCTHKFSSSQHKRIINSNEHLEQPSDFSQMSKLTTLCLKKKTSPMFLAITRESIVGFS